MTLFWKLHDRLTGVISEDCEGKPLRVGDSVLIVSTCRNGWHTKPKYLGLVCLVIGYTDCNDGRWLELDETENGKPLCSQGHGLRRIDHPDSASWDQVTGSTGWKPRVEAPARTEEVGL